MQPPESYEVWKARALQHDRDSGAEQWKQEDRTRRYDYQVIRRRHDELVEVLASNDAQRLLFYLNEGIHGNMGGMGSPALYTRARFGTKQLVTDHIHQLAAALERLEQLAGSELDEADALAVVRRAMLCFGRSALMLSGAGSLGPFHMGVVKALSEHGLLPDVISGASAGSIVAAMVGTCRPESAEKLFSPERLSSVFQLMAETQALPSAGRRADVEDLRGLIEALIPDMTFLEGLEESGRSINISVAPAQVQQRSRLLSAITSPNACIRDAVLASCAVPGVFPSVTLTARDSAGRQQPYVPSRTWIDGSITGDLPARRLARMYAVNHFISSQANPLVLWALQDPDGAAGLPARLLGICQSAARDWLRAVYPFAMEATRRVSTLSLLTRIWFSLLTQEYTADITILPERRYAPWRLLSALTPEQALNLVTEGERATWPKLEMIRNCTHVSRAIDGILQRMEARPAA